MCALIAYNNPNYSLRLLQDASLLYWSHFMIFGLSVASCLFDVPKVFFYLRLLPVYSKSSPEDDITLSRL